MIHSKAAIFDLDGTLFDSMPIYKTAVPDMLRVLGYEPRDGLYDDLRVLSAREVQVYLQREYNTRESIEELEAALEAQLLDYYANVTELKPGVPELLKSLQDKGIAMCIATATRRTPVEAALQRTGIAHYFSRIFTCAEENTGKREPLIFLRAAEFLGASPAETCVFEDAIHAIRTAKAAGFYVVAIRDEAEDDNRDEIIALADQFHETPESIVV